VERQSLDGTPDPAAAQVGPGRVHAYCVQCGLHVELFSAADRSSFDSALKASKASLAFTLSELPASGSRPEADRADESA
jgi:hypothetical protein